MTPEFSRPERIDQITERERIVEISARAEERAALARRFDLPSIERLEARLTVRVEASGIVARGQVRAAVTQACSITDEPLTVEVDETVALQFVPDLGGEEEEVELSFGALDTIHYEGERIDLGEAAAQTIALALDPFPRGPAAIEALRAAGVVAEKDARRPGKLAGLGELLRRG